MLRIARSARHILVILGFVLSMLVPVALWGIGNLVRHVSIIRSAPPARALPPVAPPAYDPEKKIAIVVTGNGGAEMTDFLTPYDLLGTTGKLNMYVVAPERRVVPLANAAVPDGGLDLVPHFSLAEYDRDIGRVPDVIVIPFLPAFAEGRERELVPWIRHYAERGTLIVSICAGSEVLAATGLLDGGPATTHPNFFGRLETDHPRVTWVRDVRYVEREGTISSGAIASGADATLAAIRRMFGRDEAVRVAREVGYEHLRFLDDPSYPARLDVASSLPAAMWPARSHAGVLLYNGVGELEVGSVFDTYALTLATKLTSITEGPAVIETRHGMRLMPRVTLAAAARFDRILVPGRAVPAVVTDVLSTWSSPEVVTLHEGDRAYPYEAALRDIARRESRLVARGIAINLNYPLDGSDLGGAAVPVSTVIMPLVLASLGLLGAFAIRSRYRAYRIRRWLASRTAGRGSNASDRSMTFLSSRTLPGQA